MAYKNLELEKETHRKYYYKNHTLLLKRQQQTRINRRNKVFTHYGKKCVCCGETLYEFLSMDHTNGGGTKHRKQLKSPNTDRWIIKNNYPIGFRILCHNCNMSLGMYGYCPHKTKGVDK
jgi:hypothetical protein